MEDAEPIPSRTISRSLGDVKGASPPHDVPSNAQNDIPGLLIKVRAAGDTAGTFSKVVYIQWVDTHGRQHLLRLPSVWGRKLACPTGPLIISMVVRTDSQHSMVREQ
jgi:hypothetical protein